MSRYGAHQRVLLTCILVVAACTAPTFAELSEAGSAAREDPDGGGSEASDVGPDASESDDPSPDAGTGSSLDAAAAPVATIDAASSTNFGDASTSTRTEPEGGADGSSSSMPDAQVTEAQVPDAQPLDSGGMNPPPDAGPAELVPAWAKPLLGRFAKRSVYFAYDVTGPLVTVTVDVALIDISSNASGQLELTGQQCGYRVYWSDGGASYTLVKPQALPRFHMWLSLGQAPHFSSDTAPVHMGYDPTRQARCTGGTYADKFDDQTWLTSGRCACTGAPEVMPTESNDCRVTDPEPDGRPGVTLDGAGFAFDINAAVNTTLKIADGEVRVDGEHVLREQHTRNVACLGSCFTMSDQLCPGGETQMRPLPANANCADALAKLDPLPYPPFPTKDCRAQ